jgi:hypothetical protein
MTLLSTGVGYKNAQAGRQVAASNLRVEQAEAGFNDQLQAAGNNLEAQQAGLARYMQSLDNTRQLEALGEATAVDLQNSAREVDFFTRGSLEDSIAAAEQTGAQLAQAAFAGQSGSTVDAINSSTALRRARARQQAEDYQGFSSYDAAQRRIRTAEQVIAGLDQSIILENFDLSRRRAPTQKVTQSPWVAGLLSGLSTASQYSGAFKIGRAPTSSLTIPSNAQTAPGE